MSSKRGLVTYMVLQITRSFISQSLPFKHNADKQALRVHVIMDKKKLSIAIPASVISDTPHLREKTSKIGSIGRAAAIFRVDEIIVYPDNAKVDQRRDLDFIAFCSIILETPQYLRKALFKFEPDLDMLEFCRRYERLIIPLSGKTKHLKWANTVKA